MLLPGFVRLELKYQDKTEETVMKVLLVNGSPNQHGCTNRALEEVAATLNNEESIETVMFWIGNKPIQNCISCHKCETTGECIFNDNVKEFHALAKKADGFVFGSPVHYAGPSGALLSFMGRAFISDFAGNENRLFKLKPAAAVVSARRAGTTTSFSQVNKFFTLHEMPVISSKYWNMVHGDVPEEVEQDLEGLYNMRVLARNMAYFLRCQEAAKHTGVKLPKEEPPVFTNFIR
jgi:multimeric flavodoxin WrbA